MWENPDLPWVVITIREIRFLLAKSTIFLAGFSPVSMAQDAFSPFACN